MNQGEMEKEYPAVTLVIQITVKKAVALEEFEGSHFGIAFFSKILPSPNSHF